MKRANINQIFRILSAGNPSPRTELVSNSPYTMLIAVVLSAQATDIGVNKATPALFAAADTPKKMIQLGEEGIKTLIRSIGLYQTKAKNIIALSKMLISNHDGIVPNNREDLEKLPGVGRKTANVVLNNVFNQPTIAVDTHVFRVSNRTGLAPGATPQKVESQLEKIVPKEWKMHAHHWLILLGRYVCKARKPKCSTCSIIEFCEYKAKNFT